MAKKIQNRLYNDLKSDKIFVGEWFNEMDIRNYISYTVNSNFKLKEPYQWGKLSNK